MSGVLVTRKSPPWIFLLLGIAMLSGCATAPGRTTTEDKWQGVNRGIYKFNDVVDRATLKPVAKGYQKITPQWLRTGVRNFFQNLESPWIMINEGLQGKPKFMMQEAGRFVVNTVVGIAGFIDVASKMDLTAHDEDFGQTLAVWGVPSGPYLMLPVFGPSTLRDGFGRIPDFFANPVRYANIPWETDTGVTVLNAVQGRAALLSTEDALNSAYDKYGVIRDAWLQRREYQIYDGNPPEPAVDPDMDEPDDSKSTEPASDEPASREEGKGSMSSETPAH